MKTALVTGASRGIGRAIAERLAADGCTVIGTYAGNKTAADEVATRLDARMLQVDFGEQDSVASLLEQLGDIEIDVLVNNAGVFEYEDFEHFDMALWRKVMRINLDAIVELTTSLRAQICDGGAIVNISSLDACVAAYDSMSYAASKAALINLTQSLAVNLAPRGVRVNGIAPGWIETDMNADSDISDSVSWTPMGRDGQTAEVASVVSFFCSADASFVTGQTLIVDGGYGLVDPVIKIDSDRLRNERKERKC
jgi:3-oxoacyl-[acyl-carrier protein] reductase